MLRTLNCREAVSGGSNSSRPDDKCRQSDAVPKPRTPKSRWTRRLRVLAAVGLAGLTLGAVFWLIVHHIPRWYQPVYVAEAELDQVRADAVRSYNQFGDGVAHRKTFDLTLDEREVSQWIAARERIWPEAGAWLPPWVQEPVVCFREGHMIVAARVTLGGSELIAAAHLSLAVGTDEMIIVRLERMTAGSLPIPVGALAQPLARLLRLEGRDLDLLPSPVADTVQTFRESEPVAVLSTGLRRANRFIWENGRRPYRLAGVKIDQGKLTLSIEPL